MDSHDPDAAEASKPAPRKLGATQSESTRLAPLREDAAQPLLDERAHRLALTLCDPPRLVQEPFGNLDRNLHEFLSASSAPLR